MKITAASPLPEFECPELRLNLFDCSQGYGSTVHPFAGANTLLHIADLPLPELRRSHKSASALKVKAVFSKVDRVPRLHFFLCELEGTGLAAGLCSWLRQSFAEVQQLHVQLEHELRQHHPFAKHAARPAAASVPGKARPA